MYTFAEFPYWGHVCVGFESAHLAFSEGPGSELGGTGKWQLVQHGSMFDPQHRVSSRVASGAKDPEEDVHVPHLATEGH